MTTDPDLLVCVFEDRHGGYLPISEFGHLMSELEEERKRADMGIVWALVGFSIGSLVGLFVKR